MDERCDYWIKGNTYELREFLKNWGCMWYPDEKAWKMYCSCPEDMDYRAIAREGLELVPIEEDQP